MRVLVLGGTGVFGSRLCRLLAADPGIALTIAARGRAAVDALACELGAAGRAFDWRRDLDGVLGEGGHDVLVHIAGPFRGQDYAVAELSSATASTISISPTIRPSCAASIVWLRRH